jgi:drug/metabolite transporter (DMT)-like permease
VLVLGERLTLPALLGMALIFAGLIVLTAGAWRRPQPAAVHDDQADSLVE